VTRRGDPRAARHGVRAVTPLQAGPTALEMQLQLPDLAVEGLAVKPRGDRFARVIALHCLLVD
jgi:hypothetical protein